MPKSDGNRGRQGKAPATNKPKKIIKKEKRHLFTMEQKYFACELKKSGKKPKEIASLFEERYKVKLTSSTLSTFYNAENMKRYETMGHSETVMASVETSINRTQRPTIIIDMEFALICMLKKSLNLGTAVRKKAIKTMAKDIFERLRGLQIYDDRGERLHTLTQMSEEQINMMLSKEKKECPVCQIDIYGDAAAVHDVLYVHIRDTHGIGRSPPGNAALPTVEDKRYKFNASDGWVKNFLQRHNMHNVATVGEMGSSDHEAANKYVKEFKDELIGRKISPKKIIQILLNIDETGIVYKSVPKRTYKFYSEPFEAKKSIKDRVTVLVGAAMDGFKLKPVVIGKAMVPRALLHTNMDELPVHYYGQPSAWMSQDIMNHWCIFYLGPEIEDHYGKDVDVILTLDNAGCHPPDLDTILNHVEVRYMPPNTTPLIQPMDQGVIYSFKRAFMERYYSKMIDYVMSHTDATDPMHDFSKMYNMKDVIMDIGGAWDTIDETLIHKCFENLLCPEDYIKQYNETYNTAEQWPGTNFRGFNTSDINTSEARGKKIKEYVDSLNNRLNNMDVTIDSDSVHEIMEYNPNEDVDTTELIHSGFYTQRLADGIDIADDNDAGINIPEKTHECLKALTNICITFRTDDYQCKEQAEKAAEHLEGLQAIFRQMKIAASNPSGTPSQPRGASLGSLPGPSRIRTSQPPSQPDASVGSLPGPSRIRTSQPASQPDASVGSLPGPSSITTSQPASQSDEVIVARFSALNPRPAATSSPVPSKSRQSQTASPPPAEGPANDTLDNMDVVDVPINEDADDTPAASPSSSSASADDIPATSPPFSSASARARASAAESAMWKRSRRSGTKHLSYQDCYSDQDFDSSSDEWVEPK